MITVTRGSLLALAFLLGSLLFPQAVAAMLVSIFVLAALIPLGRILGLMFRPDTPVEEDGDADRLPFVSVHVPTCSEPPALVKSTLRALAKQNYPHFEVVVFDNNTPDASLWQPVRALCRELGPRFKFFHVDELEGFKAGALNQALEATARAAELIFTVDADYQLDPGGLSHAVRALRPDDAFVQFPQAYRDGPMHLAGLREELAGFFRFYAQSARDCMLPTGTLTLIRRDVLDQVCGWPTESVTEDALLGVHLLGAGLKGRYCHREVGRGVMPVDGTEISKQRKRWAEGNAQTLVACLRSRMEVGHAVFLQLTAWWSFVGLGAVGLLAAALVPDVVSSRVIGWSAVGLLALELTSVILLHSRVGTWRSVVSWIHLLPVSAVAWLTAFTPAAQIFRRTAKDLSPASPVVVRPLWPAALLTLVSIALLARDLVVPSLASLLLAVLWAAPPFFLDVEHRPGPTIPRPAGQMEG